MWIHPGRLEHVLSPAAYVARAQHDAEMRRLFLPAWHFVGLEDELPRDGDQRAFELLGTPLVLRRGGGELRAFVNVCVHRHSLLAPEGRSRAAALVCPYHGFCYREDGTVARVPDASSFRGGEGAVAGLGRLRRLPLARLGTLLFVSLADDPPPFASFHDDETRTLALGAFTDDHRLVSTYRFESSCNWKVALENVLETYHVASLHRSALARHPEIFRLFTGVPEGASTHRLGDRSTSYFDSMGGDSALYLRVAEALRPGAHARYEHLHAFPALVVAHTHLVSFVQTVTPLSPERCVVEARLLACAATPLAKVARPLLGALSGRFMGGVLREDASIYERVQRGLRASPHRGVLSAREERVHAFQCHVRDRAGDVGRS